MPTPFAEEAAVEEWATDEDAAPAPLLAVQPEAQSRAVAEEGIDFALAKRLGQRLLRVEGLYGRALKEGCKKGFMRGLGDDSDRFAAQALGRRVAQRRRLAGDETRRGLSYRAR